MSPTCWTRFSLKKKKPPTRLVQKKVTQGGSTAVIPTVSTSIIRSPALVGWKNTTELGDRSRICLRKCGWKVAFCMQSPPITNHSLSLQLSVRRSVSSNKRLPKISPGMMYHVSPRKRSSFPPERRPTSRIAAGPSAKGVIKRTYRQLYSHYDFHADRQLIRTLFITTGTGAQCICGNITHLTFWVLFHLTPSTWIHPDNHFQIPINQFYIILRSNMPFAYTYPLSHEGGCGSPRLPIPSQWPIIHRLLLNTTLREWHWLAYTGINYTH